MAQSNVEKVRNLVLADPALQQRLGAAKNDAEFVDVLIGIGADRGLPFTAAEIDAWKAGEGSSLELTDDQLQQAAGGYASYGTSYGNSIWCGFCGKASGSFMQTR
jgi:predicted ribosomally synthesized peptide with nif11-like leader